MQALMAPIMDIQGDLPFCVVPEASEPDTETPSSDSLADVQPGTANFSSSHRLGRTNSDWLIAQMFDVGVYSSTSC